MVIKTLEPTQPYEDKRMTHPSYCCPKCGEQIGWTGRFFQFIRVPLHRCKKPYKVKVGNFIVNVK